MERFGQNPLQVYLPKSVTDGSDICHLLGSSSSDGRLVSIYLHYWIGMAYLLCDGMGFCDSQN
jgi:hypothetical protein